MSKTLAIASDHAGYDYKQQLIPVLEQAGYEVKDFGTNSAESTDYTDYAHPLAAAVQNGEYSQGILICGSGEGVCITANKHAGVRAALAWIPEIAFLSRQHNNANVLCLPSRFIPFEKAVEITKVFLATDFEGGRHQRRVDKIDLAQS